MFSEEWEKAILARSSSDSDHLPKKGLFKSNKTPAQVIYGLYQTDKRDINMSK
jgi:hypothetical protein